MRYYKFDIDDYRRDTMHLSALQHGIYRLLLDWMYESEKPLPAEIQVLKRKLRLKDKQLEDLEMVLEDFFILTDDGYDQKKVRETLDFIYQKSQKARDSANARWKKQEDIKSRSKGQKKNSSLKSKSNRNAFVLDNHAFAMPPLENWMRIAYDLHTTHNLLPITQCNILVKDIPEPFQTEAFDVFWRKYPKKVKKDKARASFDKSDVSLLSLLSDIDARLAAKMWSIEKDRKQFIPHPTTYLNNSGWNDEIYSQGSSGKRELPLWAKIPMDNDLLMSWANQHGYPPPGSLTYFQYRKRLESEVEARLAREGYDG